MKTILIVVAAAAGMCLTASNSYAQSDSSSDETQKSAAAVIAVDQHWSRAELGGDFAYVDQLLLPEYRSVNANGSVHPKAAILASARKNIGSSATSVAASIAAYRKAHPYGTSVALQGNTAVITFYSEMLGPEKGVKSSDILVYVDGRWHALYSQHTQVE